MDSPDLSRRPEAIELRGALWSQDEFGGRRPECVFPTLMIVERDEEVPYQRQVTVTRTAALVQR